MKIRKANINLQDRMISNVYIYENKKEEYSIIAIPELEWSTKITYEEERRDLKERLINSFQALIEEEATEQLSEKIVQWVAEM